MVSRLTLIACVLIVLLGSVTASAAPASCDRVCLKTTLDQYMNAVMKHDPAAAPLFLGFRETENAVVVRPPNGIWKTMTGLGKIQRRFMDAVTEQAGYFGIVEEGGKLAIVTLRLKVEDRKITEAEWVIARRGDLGSNGTVPAGAIGGVDFDNLIANAPSDKPLPKAAQMSRDVMLAITNSYFDGLSTHDGTIIMANPGCPRYENGMTLAGVGSRGYNATAAPSSYDCTSGLATININYVAARRYPLVDEEAGVVLGLVLFMRNPGTTLRRNLLSEWFYLEKNQIQKIYAAMFYPPAEAPLPNWPPFGGNWPLPAPAPK